MKLTTLLFSFKGRMNRLTYLGVQVGALIILIIAALLLKISTPESTGDKAIQQITPFYLFSAILYALVIISIICLWLATSVKRLHDRDQSGWWLLVSLIPLLGTIWYIVVCFLLQGTSGENHYGPDPREEST